MARFGVNMAIGADFQGRALGELGLIRQELEIGFNALKTDKQPVDQQVVPNTTLLHRVNACFATATGFSLKALIERQLFQNPNIPPDLWLQLANDLISFLNPPAQKTFNLATEISILWKQIRGQPLTNEETIYEDNGFPKQLDPIQEVLKGFKYSCTWLMGENLYSSITSAIAKNLYDHIPFIFGSFSASWFGPSLVSSGVHHVLQRFNLTEEQRKIVEPWLIQLGNTLLRLTPKVHATSDGVHYHYPSTTVSTQTFSDLQTFTLQGEKLTIEREGNLSTPEGTLFGHYTATLYRSEFQLKLSQEKVEIQVIDKQGDPVPIYFTRTIGPYGPQISVSSRNIELAKRWEDYMGIRKPHTFAPDALCTMSLTLGAITIQGIGILGCLPSAWVRTQNALTFLGYQNAVIQKKLEIIKETLPQPCFPSDLLIHVRAPHPDFVGRQDLLDTIHLMLPNSPDPTMPISVKVLFGPAGFGKTELAIQFANQNRNKFSLIWLFHCDSEVLFEQGLWDLGKALKLSIEEKSKEEIVSTIYHRLEKGIEGKPYLLIFDNLEKSHPLPERGGCCLITTRHPNFHPYPQHRLKVSRFHPHETQDLYLKIHGKSFPLEAATALTEKLEGYPIFLSFALRDPSCYLPEHCLQNLDIQRTPLLSASSERYPVAMQQVIESVGARLAEKDPIAFQFFEICIYLNPDHISDILLGYWVILKKIEHPNNMISRIRSNLIDSSLIHYNPESQLFSLHRLIQHVFEFSPIEGSFEKALNFLYEFTMPFKYEEMNSWRIGQESLLHLSVMRKSRFWDSGDPEKRIQIFINVGRFVLRAQEDGEAALALFQAALNLSQQSSHQPLETQALIYEYIGASYKSLARYEEALPMFRRSLAIQTQSLKENDPDLATTYGYIAACYAAMDFPEEALRLHQKELKIYLENYGDSHSATGTGYGNVGVAFKILERYEEALESFQKGLTIFKKTLKPSHPFIATTYLNIGLVHGLLNNQEQALESFEQSLAVQTECFEEDHETVLLTYQMMSLTSLRLNRKKEFSSYFKKGFSLTCYRKKISQLDAYLDLYSEALNNPLFIDELPIIEIESILKQNLEENHPYIIKFYRLSGKRFLNIGRNEEALQMHQQALNAQVQTLGEDHPDLVDSHYYIGISLQYLERDKEALEHYRKSLDIQLKTPDVNPIDLVKSYNAIGLVENSLGDYDQSLIYHRRALDIQIKTLGESHLDLAITYQHIGKNLEALKRCKEAVVNYHQALNILIRVPNENHSDLMQIYHHLGVNFVRLGTYEEALKMFQKTLDIQAQSFGDHHLDLGITHNNIAVCFKALKLPGKALKHLKEALCISSENKDYLDRIIDFLKLHPRLWGKPEIQEIEVCLKRNLGEQHLLTLQFVKAKQENKSICLLQ